MTDKARLLAGFLLAAVLLSGCGFPTVTYLYPPSITLSGSIISVRNDKRNYEASEGVDQTYQGIEIFYRIYQNELTASSIFDTTLPDLRGRYDKEPDTFIDIAVNTYGFMRLRNSETSGPPLIPIAANNEDLYYLQLKTDSDWLLTDQYSNPLFDGAADISKIIRSLTTSTSDTSFFKRDFKANDDDYSGSTVEGQPEYYIVFFAVSYGKDQTTVGQAVYSIPQIPNNYAKY